MLSRAAEKVGLVWNPPPRPDPSRLDEWFLGGGRAGSQRTPLRCHSSRKCMRSSQDRGRHLSWNKSCSSSPLSNLDGGAALGYAGIPSVERCKDLHEGGHDLAVLHELRAATDLVLRATKVTAHSLSRAMSTLVVQERHLWLCLADMKEQDKVQFLNSPMSQTGLFRNPVESFAQQFSAAQKQTEAIKHIMRRRKPAASTLAAAPQPALRHGHPLRPPPFPCSRSSLPPGSVVEPVADGTPSPSRPPPNLAASASARGPETGDPEMEETAHREMVTASLPSPEGGRVENLLFHFVFVPKTFVFVGTVGTTGTVSRSLASAPRSVSVAPADHQIRLHDSVHPASPQVQGHPVHLSQGRRCPCLVCGNRSPAGEECDRASPSSRY